MELNKKSRGQKHHYNKQRYQNKAKVVQQAASDKAATDKSKDLLKDVPEPEKGLTSNWHRYEELPEDNEVDESTNFSLLAQAPISHGGHFQFKSDKNIESEFDFKSLRNNKMFSLDLYLLQSSLTTIPFHERCGMDENYFTERQLEDICLRSQQNKVHYESFQRINLITKSFVEQSINSNERSELEDQHCHKSISSNKELNFEDLLDVEADGEIVSQEQQTKLKVPDAQNDQHDVEQKTEDLEQWLDDILND